MKKFTAVVIILSCGIFLAAGNATAANFTSISDAVYPGEPNLLGAGGVLETLYPLSNFTHTRIDDDFDQIWNPADGATMALVKFAGFSHDFGYIRDENGDGFFTESVQALFSAADWNTSYGYAPPVTSTGSLTGGGNFIWTLGTGAGQTNLWTSLPSQNVDLSDRMVTFLIESSDTLANDSVRKYVIAWEDQLDGDMDYNDLVVEVTVAPVPIPGAILLLGSGLLGLAGIRRKFKL